MGFYEAQLIYFVSIHTQVFEVGKKKESSKHCNYQYISSLFKVIPLRFERKTHALEGRCSIQLSYGTILNCECKGTVFIEITKRIRNFFALTIYFFSIQHPSKR